MITENGGFSLTFLSSLFDNPVLYDPARKGQSIPCTNLKVITAFTDCERISTHMINLSDGMKDGVFEKNLSVDIILGMTKSSLSPKKHEDILRLLSRLNSTKGMPKVSCRYICDGPEVHSKIYLWNALDNNIWLPRIAYCGSLNYTMNAFYKRRESISLCDPVEALNYYNELETDTIDCFDKEAKERLKNVSNRSAEEIDVDMFDSDYETYDKLTPVDILQVSLLTKKGETGYGSGINWGIRPNGTKRNKDQAYIPYNSSDRKKGFFPDRINPEDKNCPIFRVITKDFGAFHMRMAQQGNKAIHSAESNAIIGEWIRKKLGVPSGGFVTRQMLENYGKTYVVFRKYDDGTYLLDF